MALMFELSGEHPDMPAAEVLGALEAEGIGIASTIQGPGVLVVEGDDVGPGIAPVLAARLAMTKRISDFHFVCDMEEILNKGKGIALHGDTFCIRAKGVQGLVSGRDSKKVEKELGAVLSAGARVDLESPDQIVQVVLSDLAYVGSVFEEVDIGQFEARRPQKRPFFSPISLHPKLARASVNLARAPRGGTLLDPFCGTGGILMEAGLMGMRVVGGDLEEKMVQGSLTNLEHVGVKEHLLFHGDIGDLPEWLDGLDQRVSIDAVATDPPYGRATRVFGEKLADIYKRTFESMARVLERGRYLAITLPEDDMAGLIDVHQYGFVPAGHYPYRVHKSLTRNFRVFRRD